MSWVSSVGIATLEGPGIESRRGTRFSARVQTDPVAHPTSCTMGTGSLSGGGGVKRSGRGVDHSNLAPRLKKEYSTTSISPYGSSRHVPGRTLPLPLPYHTGNCSISNLENVHMYQHNISVYIWKLPTFRANLSVPSSRVKQYGCVTPQISPKRRRKPAITHVPAINPLNGELNTICHLLALLGAHHILHISRTRAKETYKNKGNKRKTVGGKSRHKTTFDAILGNS